MKVPLLDLKAQYQAIRDEIKEAVDQFQQDYVWKKLAHFMRFSIAPEAMNCYSPAF
jgi:hypothetical protein